MPTRILKICKACAELNHGRMERKCAPLYEECRCDYCLHIEKCTHPKYYKLTTKLTSLVKPDRGVKKPLKHLRKDDCVHWLCTTCAKLAGGTTNRIQCAIWQETECDICKRKRKCTEPRFYELKPESIKK